MDRLYRTLVLTNRRFALIALWTDIGWFAAEAFDYVERAIDLAGDNITRAQAIAALQRGGRGPVISFTIPSFHGRDCLGISGSCSICAT